MFSVGASVKTVILDNDTSLLRSLGIVLSGMGHDVRTFDDPLEACDYITGGAALDMLIVDFIMPGMDGRQVLEQIRNRRSIDFSVILISGHTDLLDPEAVKQMGADVFLPKPLDLDLLSRHLDPQSEGVGVLGKTDVGDTIGEPQTGQ